MFQLVLGFHFLAVAAGAPAGHPPAGATVDSSPPEGVEILLPRGAIPAITDPQFVAAGDAKIDGDSWVFGVIVDGEARAYSIALLNHHEIVNDNIAGRPLAAVW